MGKLRRLLIAGITLIVLSSAVVATAYVSRGVVGAETGVTMPSSENGELVATAASNSMDSDIVAANGSAGPRWYNIVGAVFEPANSGYSYQYGNSGCLKSNSPGYWRSPVTLPDGAIVNNLTVNFKNDMYSANSTGYLTKYKRNGDYADLGSVSTMNYTSTGTTGYFSVSSVISPAATIDNLNYGYVFIWSGSTTQRLCGMQVGYSTSSATFVPTVIKNAN